MGKATASRSRYRVLAFFLRMVPKVGPFSRCLQDPEHAVGRPVHQGGPDRADYSKLLQEPRSKTSAAKQGL